MTRPSGDPARNPSADGTSRTSISRSPASRNLVLASTVFGLFILFDIGLFAWLILDSLSQRELEEALLETREQAEPIAEELARNAELQNSSDLLFLVNSAEETQTYIESVLSRRSLVRTIQIRDADGNVVYRKSEETALPIDEDAKPRIIDDGKPEPSLIETEMTIGAGLGTLVIGVSEEAVQERITVLRRDLVRQTSLIGAFTVTLLLVASVAFLRLWRRARGLEEQAQEAERMAYVGTLASGLAHEIRSPLNSLSLNMQMLEEEARESGESASQKRLLAITRSELRRLEGLATDFLAYARPQALNVQKTAAIDLLHKARDVLAGEIRLRGVSCEVEDRSAGAMVEVDAGQINQLLLNLIQNALAAMAEVDRAGELRLVARRDERGVNLEVIDNGPGVPDEVRRRMFDLFYSNRKGGTGLGLAIVQRIAESHGAEVEVDTAADRGTTVRLRLRSRR